MANKAIAPLQEQRPRSEYTPPAARSHRGPQTFLPDGHFRDRRIEVELGPPAQAPELRPQRALLILAAAIAVAIGVALLIGKAAAYEHVVHSLRAAQPEWLAVALPGEVLAYVGYTLALRRAAELSGGPSFSALIGARLALTSLAATRLIVAGGPGLLYWALRRAHLSKRGALARLAALNILLYAVFVGAAALAALAVLLGEQRPTARAIALGWLLGVAATVAAVLLGTGLASLNARARRLLKLAGGLVSNRRRTSALSGAGLFWLGDILCLWAGLRAFDVWVPETRTGSAIQWLVGRRC